MLDQAFRLFVYDEFMWNVRICAQYYTQMERDTGSATGSFYVKVNK